MFTTRQYGFIKGKSTVLQLLQILDDWTLKLENGGQIDVIYTDFEKAFDKVSHKRLIHKLYSYGINTDIILWIEAFLTNRKQRVQVNAHYSDWTEVLSGIPQGSILGPLLFIIYINDLIDVCQNSTLFLYADDAKIYRLVTENNDCLELQNDLNNFNTWAINWQLKLNASKCNIVSYGRNIVHDFNYTLSGTTINRTDNIKDLGVIFDSKLKFCKHIDDKVNKAYQNLGIIKRNFIHLTANCFILLYKSLVRSHLEYANSV